MKSVLAAVVTGVALFSNADASSSAPLILRELVNQSQLREVLAQSARSTLLSSTRAVRTASALPPTSCAHSKMTQPRSSPPATSTAAPVQLTPVTPSLHLAGCGTAVQSAAPLVSGSSAENSLVRLAQV